MSADDTILTVRQAANLFTVLRASKVSTHMVYGWINRYGLVKDGRGYRYADLLDADLTARGSDTGGGRGRPKPAL